MQLIRVLRKPRYAAISMAASCAMLIAYPYAQTLGNNIILWFKVIQPLNLLLYIVFSIVFGFLVALQVHNLKQPKTCLVRGAAGGTISSIISLAAVQCPGCASIASLFLPIGATTFLAVNNLIITGISIALLIVGIHMLGGFRTVKK